MARPRLTPHQAEVLARITRHARPGRPAVAENIGSVGACAHLVQKGRIERVVLGYGPRGAERIGYQPIPTPTKETNQ